MIQMMKNQVDKLLIVGIIPAKMYMALDSAKNCIR